MRHKEFWLAIALLCILPGCRNRAVTPPLKYVFPDANDAPDSLLAMAQVMEENAQAGSTDAKALAGIYLGTYYSRTGSYRQSKKAFGKTLAATDAQTAPPIKSRLYSGLGNAAKNLGEYPEALKMFSIALNHSGADSLATAGIHGNIAQVFQQQSDFKQAVVHLNEARLYLQHQTDNTAYLKVLHTLANVYGESGNTDSALMLDEEGLAISRRARVQVYESAFLNNKANCFMYTNRPDSARIYFHKSRIIDSALGDPKQMSDTWLNLGALEQMQGQPALAIPLLKRAIHLADSCAYRGGAMLAYKTLAGVYEDLDDYKQALSASDTYHAIRDSIANERKDAAVAEWKAVYETSRKESELRVQALQLRQQRQMTWAISVCGVLLLAGLYYAYRRNRIRKERRYRETLLAREQEAAREIVLAEEAERRRIAADLHDGIGQTLTAAWLNLQAMQPKLHQLEAADATLLGTTTKLVGESCAEIRQISHNMMPAMLLHQGLVPAIHELAGRLHDVRLDVSLSVDMSERKLEQGTELIVFRIIQECVNNVVKHARATAIYISISADETGLDLMIEDNGIGLESNVAEGRPGVGMHNIRSRVHYLRGSVEWSSGGDGGTVVAIHIPVHHDDNS